MANILYRGSATPSTVNSAGGKNAALTNVEIDQNFYALERDKFDKVLGGTITGNATFASSSTVTIDGNLIVNGTTTTINSTTVDVDDINITLGSVASPTNATANGGGITLKGATDKTFNWYSSTSAWTSSEHLSLASGKNILLNGSTSGTITLAVPATAGTNTITFQAATGTVAHLSNIGDGSITVNTGSGLSGSGSFTTNQNGATTITLSHADTSSVTDLSSANNTFITAQTYDTFGHVLTRTTGTVDFTVSANYAFQNIAIASNSGYTWGTVNTNTTQSADSSSDTLTLVNGGGINLYTSTVSGTDAILIEHSDTSSVSNLSSDNTGNTFIQDISLTFDTYGHVTGASVATGTVAIGNGAMTVTAGSGLTGGGQLGTANQTGASSVTISHADTSSVVDVANSQNTYVSGITFDTYGHVTGITRNTVAEYDTLATVTSRGATTTTHSTFSSGITTTYLSLSGNSSSISFGGGTIGGNAFAAYNDFSYSASGSKLGFWLLDDTNGGSSCFEFGDVNATSPSFILNINGTITKGSWDGNPISKIGINYNNDSNSTYQMLWGSGNAIYGTGGIYCNPSTDMLYADSFNATSDIRKKHNVKTIENALSKVEELRGVSFTMNDSGKNMIGVVAQEILEVIPEVVDEGSDGTLTVAYGNIVGVLIEAIKELNTKVEELQNQLANK